MRSYFASVCTDQEDLSSRIRLPLTNLCCLFRQQVALSSVVSWLSRQYKFYFFKSFLCGQDRRDRPTQDPNEGKKSPPKPKPEPEPAIPEGRCNLHPTSQHKAKDCPALKNTARFSGYLGPASQGDAQPGVAPLEPREDPPEDDQPGDQGNLFKRVLSTGRVQLDPLSRSVRRT